MSPLALATYPSWFASAREKGPEAVRSALHRRHAVAVKEAMFGGSRRQLDALCAVMLAAALNCDWLTVAILRDFRIDSTFSDRNRPEGRNEQGQNGGLGNRPLISTICRHGSEEAQDGILDLLSPRKEDFRLGSLSFVRSERMLGALLALAPSPTHEDREMLAMAMSQQAGNSRFRLAAAIMDHGADPASPHTLTATANMFYAAVPVGAGREEFEAGRQIFAKALHRAGFNPDAFRERPDLSGGPRDYRKYWSKRNPLLYGLLCGRTPTDAL